MDKPEEVENIEPQKIFARAIELITELEHSKNGNGLLLTYDPDAEKFQFLAMHADTEEVYALLLSGMGVVRDAIKDVSNDRTLN